MNVGNRDQVMG